MNDFKKEYAERIKLIDDYMRGVFAQMPECEPPLGEAMEYAVFSGGKRIRSVLCIETARMLTGSIDAALPFAAAIEFIHAFSLVHDDLPCMDNDDYRRGKPSCHKKFGEDIALLAGDALLCYASEIMADACENGGKNQIRAMRHVLKSAGIGGMINGQAQDLAIASKGKADEKKLVELIEQKTMALIMTGIVSAAYLSDSDEKTVQDLFDFAYNIGIAFQIRDDFEDEAEDSKSEHNSPNFINTLGRFSALERMNGHRAAADNIIDKYKNNEFIKGLIGYLFD